MKGKLCGGCITYFNKSFKVTCGFSPAAIVAIYVPALTKLNILMDGQIIIKVTDSQAGGEVTFWMKQNPFYLDSQLAFILGGFLNDTWFASCFSEHAASDFYFAYRQVIVN